MAHGQSPGTENPPSTTSTRPVTYEAASEARNPTTSAISSGQGQAPHRDPAEEGMLIEIARLKAALDLIGQRPAWRHRVHANSSARPFQGQRPGSPESPAFAAVYDARPEMPVTAAIEPTLTITPLLDASICGATAREHQNGPFRSVSTTWRHSSSVYAAASARTTTPAQLTSTSTRPCLATIESTPRRTEAGSPTSTMQRSARRPAARNSSTYASSAAASRPQMTTVQPCSARRRLIARARRVRHAPLQRDRMASERASSIGWIRDTAPADIRG